MKILFCSDGSSQAEKAVRFGAPFAAACGAETSILGIAEKPGHEDPLLEALRRAREILREHSLNAELITKAGRPVHEIVKRTRESTYDLVVIGAERKGTHGPVWMSALAYEIIESVEPPVLVVIGDRPSLRRILFCTGDGMQSDTAVEFAGEIARCGKAVVDLFHVMAEPPAMFADLIELEEDTDRVLTSNSLLGLRLRHQKEVLEKPGVFGEFRLRHGLVVPELLKELRRTEYDLVVCGSSPAEGMLHTYVMGDVTREIVNRAGLPVLVMRPGPRQIMRHFRDLVSHLFRRPRETSEATGD
ncbi:universal stress protein [Geobacter sp.]|uniref:universal stress protein n=1 Tax=Geobacter sp. TaxID=46610 RepID=UPI0026065B26|nr:universal stress protein [Geobacter sp.]